MRVSIRVCSHTCINPSILYPIISIANFVVQIVYEYKLNVIYAELDCWTPCTMGGVL